MESRRVQNFIKKKKNIYDMIEFEYRIKIIQIITRVTFNSVRLS